MVSRWLPRTGWLLVKRLLALAVLLGVVAWAAAGAPGVGSPPGVSSASPGSPVTVVYGQDGGPLALDVYRATGGAGRSPVLLLLHGGGWVAGGRSELSGAAASLAGQGYTVVNADYGLASAGDPGYPREVRDVTAAYRWTRAHVAGYGGDPGRIGLIGSSAGAHLVAMLATEQARRAKSPIRAVVMLSGPTDLTRLDALLGTGAQCAGLDAATCSSRTAAGRALLTFIGCASATTCPAGTLRHASPVDRVTRHTPPFFIANSTHELVPLSQARELAAALRAHGVPYRLDVLPGSAHADAYVGQVTAPVLRFLHDHLRG